MIETLDDLNAQACCCDLTLCPVPVMDCESITLQACGYQLPDHPDVPPADFCKRFATKTQHIREERTDIRTDYTFEELTEETIVCRYIFGSDPCEEQLVSTLYHKNTDIEWLPPNTPWVYSTTYDSSTSIDTPCSGTTTYTDSLYPENNYSDPFDQCGDCSNFFEPVALATVFSYSDYIYTYHYDNTDDTYIITDDYTITYGDLIDGDYVVTQLAAKDMDTDTNGELCYSALYSQVIGGGDGLDCEETLEGTRARVRFQIPKGDPTFTGTYFKITYDIIEEPTGWDDTVPTVFRTFVSEDNVLEWTPTGTPPTDPDDPYWFTDWITLDPPSVPGTRRIVNIRFVCRENWFIGEVPQVMGEAVTLPDP